jgi:hypothetical protein
MSAVAACRTVYKADFEVQPEQDAAKIHSFEGMYRLLVFADAVDSTPGVLASCLGNVSELKLHANLGEQQLVLCPAKEDYTLDSDSMQLEMRHCVQVGNITDAYDKLGVPADNKEQAQAFKQQVAAQTEQLLWLAYRMQLQPLVQCLHRFIRSGSLYDDSLLRGRLDAVFTDGVLEAVSVSSLNDCKGAWVNSVLCQDISFAASTADVSTGAALLEHVDVEQAEQDLRTEFEAVLKSEVLGIAAGTKVTVCLEVFKGRLFINGDEHKLHLRVGHRVNEQGHEDELARWQGGVVDEDQE